MLFLWPSLTLKHKSKTGDGIYRSYGLKSAGSVKLFSIKGQNMWILLLLSVVVYWETTLWLENALMMTRTHPDKTSLKKALKSCQLQAVGVLHWTVNLTISLVGKEWLKLEFSVMFYYKTKTTKKKYNKLQIWNTTITVQVSFCVYNWFAI